MPSWPALTDRVILATVVLLVAYDVVAGVMGGGPATISARMQAHGYRFPIICVAIGGLICHWFWPVFSRSQ